MRLGQKPDGLCCSIVSWGLAAVNKQIVGDLVVAGQASFMTGSLQCAMLLFLRSNCEAHGRSVTHEMSIDHSVGEVRDAQLASLLNQLSVSYFMQSSRSGFQNDGFVCNGK